MASGGIEAVADGIVGVTFRILAAGEAPITVLDVGGVG